MREQLARAGSRTGRSRPGDFWAAAKRSEEATREPAPLPARAVQQARRYLAFAAPAVRRRCRRWRPRARKQSTASSAACRWRTPRKGLDKTLLSRIQSDLHRGVLSFSRYRLMRRLVPALLLLCAGIARRDAGAGPLPYHRGARRPRRHRDRDRSRSSIAT